MRGASGSTGCWKPSGMFPSPTVAHGGEHRYTVWWTTIRAPVNDEVGWWKQWVGGGTICHFPVASHCFTRRAGPSSQVVYDAMEEIVASGDSPIYAAFQDTGLERTGPLVKDIAWFKEAYGMEAPAADGPGVEYAAFLKAGTLLLILIHEWSSSPRH